MHAHIFWKAILFWFLKGSCGHAAAGSDTLCCLFGLPCCPCCYAAAPRVQRPEPGFGDNCKEMLREATGPAPGHKKWVGGLSNTIVNTDLISQSRKESKGGASHRPAHTTQHCAAPSKINNKKSCGRRRQCRVSSVIPEI